MPTSARIGFAFIAVSAFACAQTSTTTTPAPTAPTTGTNNAPTAVPQVVTPQSSNTTPRQPAQPIFISGIVTLADGTEPPDRALIERICSTNSVRSEGYTDSKGRFSLQLGQSLQLVPDASETMFSDGTQGFSSTTRSSTSNQSGTDPYFDCELRARLAGHRSSTIVLAGRRAMDSPNVGTLILYPIVKTEGLALSATTAAASKDARKAYEKGLSEAKKQKREQAEKEFRKAVDLHPKYAEAWLELGKTYAGSNRLPEARDALSKAIAADPQFVYPYEQLYRISFEEANWQELADTTDRLLRLNPYEFPEAYYFNGVAHYQLKNYDAAQKSLQQAIGGDRRNVNPKAHYVLGLVMVQKHDYVAAAESLMAFAALSPNDSQIPKVQAILAQIEKALQE